MAQATIRISGVGCVEIDTDLNEVFFCGGKTADGVPVNCTLKKVSRSAANAAAAVKNREYVLTEIKPGYYML